jgi:integrase
MKDRSWYGSAFTFDLQTGLRPEELMALIWDDVDATGMTLRIERACKWYGTGCKGLGKVKSKRSDRLIELSKDHISFLQGHREKMKRHAAEMKKAGKWLGEPFVIDWVNSFRPRQSYRYRNTELIFPSRLGSIPNATVPRLSFHRLLRASGLTGDRLKARWYDLRHSHATYLLTLGIPPHEVAARLGHSVEVLNKVYAHVLEGRQRRASSLFLSIVPVEISAAVSRPEILNHIKRVVEMTSEDIETSLIQLVGGAVDGW